MSRRTTSLGLIGTDPVSKGAFALTRPQVTEHMLRAFGVQTCGELYRKRCERGRDRNATLTNGILMLSSRHWMLQPFSRPKDPHPETALTHKSGLLPITFVTER